MSVSISLQAIRIEQFDVWEEMRHALYPILDSSYNKQEMREIINKPEWFCYFIMQNDTQIVGMVELSSRNIVDSCLSTPVAYLEGLYLQPSHRNQGIGKEVMHLITRWCVAKGFKELATDTELDNVHAQRFYKQLGFEETDRTVAFRLALD